MCKVQNKIACRKCCSGKRELRHCRSTWNLHTLRSSTSWPQIGIWLRPAKMSRQQKNNGRRGRNLFNNLAQYRRSTKHISQDRDQKSERRQVYEMYRIQARTDISDHRELDKNNPEQNERLKYHRSGEDLVWRESLTTEPSVKSTKINLAKGATASNGVMTRLASNERRHRTPMQRETSVSRWSLCGCFAHHARFGVDRSETAVTKDGTVGRNPSITLTKKTWLAQTATNVAGVAECVCQMVHSSKRTKKNAHDNESNGNMRRKSQ